MVHAQMRSDTPRRLRAGLLPAALPALAAALLFAFPVIGLGQDNQRPPRRVLQRVAPSSWANEWSRGAVFYEVFVRSFADSNGDGIGDLKGLIAKLDYLNDGNPDSTTDLGVDALWLMPVFASPSYHGFDTIDYERINPEYGTDDDFAALCSEAHRRGIRVIVDFVINHSGSGHPWFVDSS
ncbi:MAG: alpha-amylase family glycosyl hydrolase, partial [Thermoanaerobaculaceae bacterium]|nr:alpha-amylase family glycosyl hydrolase [Thermoanaerobaculaceae bacterium]